MRCLIMVIVFVLPPAACAVNIRTKLKANTVSQSGIILTTVTVFLVYFYAVEFNVKQNTLHGVPSGL